MLIVVVNPNLLNPGPIKAVKVVSFNCQGLIPFSELDEDHPKLNVTKIYEINQYLIEHEPDIILLNETWLKKSIKNGEFFQLEFISHFVLTGALKLTHLTQVIPKSLGKMVGVSSLV